MSRVLLLVAMLACGAVQSVEAGKDLYKVLNIDRGADDRTVKKMYRKLALEHHPDKGGDVDKFAEISQAYDVLSDPEKRKIYDDYGEDGVRQAEAGQDPRANPFGGMGGGFPGGFAGSFTPVPRASVAAPLHPTSTSTSTSTTQETCRKCQTRGTYG